MNTKLEYFTWLFLIRTKQAIKNKPETLQLNIGTSIIFLNSSNKVLLLLRDDKEEIPYPNCWDIPGGSLDIGETPKETIIREMLEEIEFNIEAPKLFNKYLKLDRIEYTFWQTADFNLEKINLHEGQLLKWFSKTDIITMPDFKIAFDFKPVLLEFFETKKID